MKFVMRVKCDLKNCSKIMSNWEKSSPNMIQETIERIDEYHSDVYIKTSLPFPFRSRDFVVTKWEFPEPKRYIFFIYSITRADKPEIENLVRGHIYASGMILEQDEENPEYTIIDHFNHSDGKIKLPKWIINQQWRATVTGLKLLRENLDPTFSSKKPKKNKKKSET